MRTQNEGSNGRRYRPSSSRTHEDSKGGRSASRPSLQMNPTRTRNASALRPRIGQCRLSRTLEDSKLLPRPNGAAPHEQFERNPAGLETTGVSSRSTSVRAEPRRTRNLYEVWCREKTSPVRAEPTRTRNSCAASLSSDVIPFKPNRGGLETKGGEDLRVSEPRADSSRTSEDSKRVADARRQHGHAFERNP